MRRPTVPASFWAKTLEYELETIPPEIETALESSGDDLNAAAAIIDSDSDGPRLFFKRMELTASDSMPIHLDIDTEDREATVNSLQGYDATLRETKNRKSAR